MVSGQRRTLYHKSRFVVRIDGIEGEAGFGKAGPLEVEAQKVEYRSGGAKIPYKDAGNVDFSRLTLERGATEDDVLYLLFRNQYDASSDSGVNREDYVFNMTIEQLDNARNVVKRYRIYEAIVYKYTAGDWDGSANEFNLEMVEIEYAYFEQETLV